jgi:azurin
VKVKVGLIAATDVTGFAWRFHPATDIAGFVVDDSGATTATDHAAGDVTDPRLVAFRMLWGAAAQRLVTALVHGLTADGGLALRLLAPRS